MKNVIIAPSLLSADFSHLEEEILKVQQEGAKFLHLDVMDGHFVPNISLGIPVIKSIAKIHHMINDVHIMIENPLYYADKFVEAGADYLTFHLEACKDENEAKQIAEIIHSKNAKAGISIKPNTPVEAVLPILSYFDLVLVMSVEPGFGGQSFIPSALSKIKQLRKFIDENKLNVLIEVDGGINDVSGPQCVEAGVDILVAGSYLFGHEDLKERMEKLLK